MTKTEILPLGLKQKPYGYPLMFDAFIGCVNHSLSVDKIRIDFKNSTGHDLSNLATGGINLAIDQASGYQKNVIEAFINFVNENIWGISDSQR